ncbi:MAG: hypothetical protein ABEH80_04175 [Halobaculum sp.]|jgi:hypothetical protein
MATTAKNGPTVDPAVAEAVESAVASTVGGTVTTVEWWAHRLLGTDGRSVAVYRAAVGTASTEAYYVLVGEHDTAVYSADEYDSVVNLVSAYRADTEGLGE